MKLLKPFFIFCTGDRYGVFQPKKHLEKYSGQDSYIFFLNKNRVLYKEPKPS